MKKPCICLHLLVVRLRVFFERPHTWTLCSQCRQTIAMKLLKLLCVVMRKYAHFFDKQLKVLETEKERQRSVSLPFVCQQVCKVTRYLPLYGERTRMFRKNEEECIALLDYPVVILSRNRIMHFAIPLERKTYRSSNIIPSFRWRSAWSPRLYETQPDIYIYICNNTIYTMLVVLPLDHPLIG